MQNRYRSSFRRRGWIAWGGFLLLLLPGCGENSTISIVPERPRYESFLDDPSIEQERGQPSISYYKSKYRLLGRLYLDGNSKDDVQPIVIDVHRREHAYMLEAPIVTSERSRTCFVVGGHKEHRLMTGLQFRWSF